MPNTPNLLIVGSMKSATTTLYDLLAAHPEIYGPEVKEPAFLVPNRYSDEHCRELYKRHFAGVADERYLLEGSTAYTMRPKFEQCAERARWLLGAEAKIIYMIREPLGRIRSHYTHLFRTGRVDGSFEETLKRNSSFVEISRYFYQIEPWLLSFGRENVFVVDFEKFTQNPEQNLLQIQNFLGFETPFPRQTRAANVGANLPSMPAWVHSFQTSGFYKTRIAPRMPRSLRDFLVQALGRRAAVTNAQYSEDSAIWVLNQLKDDYWNLASLLGDGVEEPDTVWDFQRLLKKYTTYHRR